MSQLPAGLTFRPVEAATWGDFERLFESRGAPSYCWCMPYRATSEENRSLDRVTRKEGMRARVMASVPVGLLAYAADEPHDIQSIGRMHSGGKRYCVPTQSEKTPLVKSGIKAEIGRLLAKRGNVPMKSVRQLLCLGTQAPFLAVFLGNVAGEAVEAPSKAIPRSSGNHH